MAVLYVLASASDHGLLEAAQNVLGVLIVLGFLSGTGLLIKRIVKPRMRYISCPDDFIANFLVDIFVLGELYPHF